MQDNVILHTTKVRLQMLQDSNVRLLIGKLVVRTSIRLSTSWTSYTGEYVNVDHMVVLSILKPALLLLEGINRNYAKSVKKRCLAVIHAENGHILY